jgi:hypothetical protein
VKFRVGPHSASYDLAVDGDGNAARINGVPSQEFRDCLVAKWLVEPVHANHVRLLANSRASKELRGANVTPWR